MARKYPVVLVTWLDAEVSNSWSTDYTTTADDVEDTIVETLGFLVKETAKYVTVASTLAGDHTNAVTRIPVGMIKSMKKVRT